MVINPNFLPSPLDGSLAPGEGSTDLSEPQAEELAMDSLRNILLQRKFRSRMAQLGATMLANTEE